MKPSTHQPLNRFLSYRLNDGTGRTRVGHLDADTQTITPLAFASGAPVEDLYQVIEAGEETLIPSPGEPPFPFLGDNVTILAPLRGRDVLAIGKNYREHAREFNASGYDASDTKDMPTHPVVFTKRSTSVVAYGEDILLHEDFTHTLDYEGEIGVIVGKKVPSGSSMCEMTADEDAWWDEQYVWGYTIINDVTARERQRDHKQFFLGKSGDSYCPMGPVAVPRSALLATCPPSRSLAVTTRVNGELRQEGRLGDLIFSVPRLLRTLSAAQTLRPGDVIATGTPAGVGFGLAPPVFLRPGDVVEVSVTGLGTLRNKVVLAHDDNNNDNHVSRRVRQESAIPVHNLARTNGGVGLVPLPGGKKLLNAATVGRGPRTVAFIHGLGGSTSSFSPLLHELGLNDDEDTPYTSVLFDLEGHGLSPTAATSKVTIASYAQDARDLLSTLGPLPQRRGVTVAAHGMGCLVALELAVQDPGLVGRLVLLGPPPAPLPAEDTARLARPAARARGGGGMRDVVADIDASDLSDETRASRPLSVAAAQMSLLAQDPEGYAKGCAALAGAAHPGLDFGRVGAEAREGEGPLKVLLVAGAEDRVATPDHVQRLAATMEGGGAVAASVVVLPDVGRWHVFEDPRGVAEAVREFLGLV